MHYIWGAVMETRGSLKEWSQRHSCCCWLVSRNYPLLPDRKCQLYLEYSISHFYNIMQPCNTCDAMWLQWLSPSPFIRELLKEWSVVVISCLYHVTMWCNVIAVNENKVLIVMALAGSASIETYIPPSPSPVTLWLAVNLSLGLM